MKKLIEFLVLMLLIVPTFNIVFGQTTNVFNEIIVPDDHPTIKDAIDNANDGDTIFVRIGTYYENLVVDKSIILKGENKNLTIIDGSEYSDVIRVLSDNVSISGFTVKNSATEGFFYAGIKMVGKSNVNISGNIISNNMRGIHSMNSNDLIIHNNEFINDSVNIDGWEKSDHDHDIKDNTINGKPLYYFKNQDGFTVPYDAGQVILFNCDDVIIKEMNISNTDCGIQLNFCEGCVIMNSNLSNIEVYGIMIDACSNLNVKNNDISSGMFGIIMSDTLRSKIENNSITGNIWVGISLYYGCLENEISGNKIDLNLSGSFFDFPSTGLWVRYYCNSNIFIDNTISNCQIGLWMESSDENIVKTNFINECHIVTSQQSDIICKDSIISTIKTDILPMTITKGVGILLLDTSANEINLNTITDNDIGIVIFRSWLDSISFNNILDSTTGIDFITSFSLGYYPLNYWGSSVTGPVFKCNKLFCLIPWSPVKISEAP
jgi:parallel beta-helix repeat protein